MQLFNRLGEMMEGNAKKIIEPAWDVIQKDDCRNYLKMHCYRRQMVI